MMLKIIEDEEEKEEKEDSDGDNHDFDDEDYDYCWDDDERRPSFMDLWHQRFQTKLTSSQSSLKNAY